MRARPRAGRQRAPDPHGRAGESRCAPAAFRLYREASPTTHGTPMASSLLPDASDLTICFAHGAYRLAGEVRPRGGAIRPLPRESPEAPKGRGGEGHGAPAP